MVVNITNVTPSISTDTGALIVAGGVGIGGDLYVGGEIIAQKITVQYTTVTTTLIETDDIITTFNTTNSTSTDTGALIVAGGAGIGGDVNIGGNIQIVNTSYIGGAQIITTATIGDYRTAGPSIVSSTTPPANPSVGDFWYVADLGILSVYKLDQGEYYWLDITGRTVLTSVQPQDGPVDFMMWSLLRY